ncbi:hypothetical protein CDV31_016527 [Fusarium ambrosium]|uniref:Uncharacterized protein n=1 Tax=Fusarium ambrosium TaxID=131363 RepID=A0A428S780_9HYPO|nr:hypothetical protein CDV31_016527 [Fusarium ambrosium]
MSAEAPASTPAATTTAGFAQNNWRWCQKCSSLFYRGDALCVPGRVHDHSSSGTYTLSESATGQVGWKWCKNCQVLSFTGNGTIGPCKAGGQHDVSGSSNYRLQQNGDGQDNWRWCRKCQVLSFAGGPVGDCQAGGKHDFNGSGNYSLCIDGNPRGIASGQDQWRWCNKCQALAFDGHTCCPAGGAHINTTSWNYTLIANDPALPNSQSGWMWCNKCYGLAYSKDVSDGTCPRGGTHDHAGSADYALPMNVGPSGGQNQWSWCKWCQQLWWSGNGEGRCSHSPVGGHSTDRSADYTLSFKEN